jgi:hypothetical protein
MSSSLKNRVTSKLLKEDQTLLAKTKAPIVTLSASFRDVVEAEHHLADTINHPDIVLSRAHYSMAYGVAVEAWGGDDPEPSKAWLVDPTNYVQAEQWSSVAFMERVGKVLARYPLLTSVKRNILDRRARSKLPIEAVITPPLLALIKDLKQPLLCFHIELGNILAKNTKKTIIQAVTDPHVREQYTDFADKPNLYFAVFDEPTRDRFLEIAALRGKKVDPTHVVVTGPFVDPRVLAAGTKKSATTWKKRPLRILLTTGGLGTNKPELGDALDQLLPLLSAKKPTLDLELMYYAGTNEDHADMVRNLAKKYNVTVGLESDAKAKLRLLYADDIVAANELLVEHGFPWADVVLAKPSGDMAYDAVAAGCGLILLGSWGEWEDNIASIFTRLGVARQVELKKLVEQLQFMVQPIDGKQSWLEEAMIKAHEFETLFPNGVKNILKLAERM